MSEGAEHEHAHVGSKYDLSHRQNVDGVPEITSERLGSILQAATKRLAQNEGQDKKAKKKSTDTLRKALAVALPQYPPVLLDHAFTQTQFDRTLLPSAILEEPSLLEKLMMALKEADRVVQEITSADVATGYIVAKEKSRAKDDKSEEAAKEGNLMYDDYHPFRPCQFEEQPGSSFLEFTGFNKTVDEFYSSIEGQKLESRLQEREDNAQRKIEHAKEEHEKRIGGLQQLQELNVQRAQAIEANLDRVEEATAAINGLIAQGMDWHEVGRLIEMEQKRRNPVAEIIRLPLKLHENTATLALAPWDAVDDDEMADETDSEASDDSDDEEGTTQRSNQQNPQVLAVDIDLGQSAWANARGYYETRRVAATKQDKTMQASARALKSTEQKIKADLKKGLKQEKQLLTAVRKQMWFEKFIYFISSDGYLVLGGKDSQQNDLLYKRHLDIGDVYVSADLNGATSVIIKNNPATPHAPIPPSTLSQAGSLAVCTSTAWESKAVMSAWWVDVKQISKTAPTGEYLQPGRFNIDGKKRFLPPAQLLLGFAIMFRIDEESKARHNKHRVTESDNAPEEVQVQPVHADGDSDDEFPDAGPAQGEDTEEDGFPDAGAEDSDDDKSVADQKANPLQPAGQEETDSASDESDDDEQPAAASGATEPEPEPETRGDHTPEQNSASQKSEEQRKKPQGQAKTKVSQLPRGKRTKAKKAAARYANQDEEERKLAMALLGAKIKDVKPSDSNAEKETGDTQPVNNKSREEAEQEARARRRAQHDLTQKQGLEEERARRERLQSNVRISASAEDEDDDPVDESEPAEAVDKTSRGIDSLIGCPLPGDNLLEAIPVCAPWSTLAHYKYKAKLQPGAAKKGKAIREVLGRWTADHGTPRFVDVKAEDKEKLWPREGELLRGLKEAECMVVPVKSVRLLLSGGSSGGGAKGKNAGKGKRGGRGSKRK